MAAGAAIAGAACGAAAAGFVPALTCPITCNADPASITTANAIPIRFMLKTSCALCDARRQRKSRYLRESVGFEIILFMPPSESSSRNYRIGLLGAGGIAPEHADALGLLNGVEIVSVCDLQEQRARALAEQYSIPRTYSSLKEMLARENLDVVHVLTQPQHHVTAAIESLRAGVNVYIEKPMGLSTSDCELVASEASTHGCAAGVNHNMARNRRIDEIVQAARDRKFGRINHVSVTFCVGVGSLPVKEVNHYMFSTPQAFLFEYCPHPFSVIRRLLGKPIEVTALSSEPAQLGNGKKYYRSWEIAAITERGTAQLFFSVERGNSEVTVSVYGQDACALADLIRSTLIFHENSPYPITANLRDGIRNAGRIFRQATGVFWDDYLIKFKLKPASLRNSFYPGMAAFYDALRAGRPVEEDAWAGRDVIAYCEMAAANMKTAG
jgi:predicted dehydrogenase